MYINEKIGYTLSNLEFLNKEMAPPFLYLKIHTGIKPIEASRSPEKFLCIAAEPRCTKISLGFIAVASVVRTQHSSGYGYK
ncbi:MAG: hypothetical protein AUK48_10170 [Oscillatoriales cyanobacterium CG2_30_44_21]|nr:MAG: hypothetical protein AUK48_10170 [Oscillatoriales cyanobacterium CG2_30_44_21]